MHDIKAIRAEPGAFDAAMARRRLGPQSGELLTLDQSHRDLLTAVQATQADRNALSREVAAARRAGLESSEIEAEAVRLKEAMEHKMVESAFAKTAIDVRLSVLPNLLDSDVPDGWNETFNVEVKRWGTPSTPDFPAREHFELGEALGQMDFAGAAKIAGSRFTVLRGSLARLERALGQFMLDLHTTQHGYTEMSVPSLVNDAAVYGTGQLPKFKGDLFRTTDKRWLIPTAEVPLTNLVAGEILDPKTLPIRMTALTDCFRSEAGAAGRDTRGMLRQHQFRKVELVSIVAPEDSDAEHERMTCCAEAVLEALELPYRRMLLCAGDTGFGAAKTYDLEVWLPGQGAFREISSCSNTRAFQARRMNTRVRGEKHHVAAHTLNGSGVAVGRALIAVLEVHQRADGSIAIPAALRPAMGGIDRIPA